MKKRFLVALTVVLVARPFQGRAIGGPERPAPPDHAECSHLVMLKFPDVKVTEATAVPAAQGATTGAIRAAYQRNRVALEHLRQQASPLKGTARADFNQVVSDQELALTQTEQLKRGYAVVATDTGHQGGAVEAGWALNNIERRVNFGYLAVHRTADVAKSIVLSYYGSASTRSYFSGCSRGGGQAMMEALRYPDDFDGVVAGAPAMDWTGIGAQFIKDAQAAFPAGASAPLVTPDVLKSIDAQIMAACDALDGVKDGTMEDPRRCTLSVDKMTGLTDAQRIALKKIYSETRARDGVLFPGQPYGGEGELQGWPAWITGAPLPGQTAPSLRVGFGTELFKYFVFNDPAWDYTKYQFANFRKDTELTASYLNSNDPKLDAFKAKNHKVIMWHGWADAGLSPLGTTEFYEQVEARDPNARDFFRLFMLPGVLHCGGGRGPDTVDWVSAIVDWVEHGKAPDRLVARKAATAGGAIERTRPLCPYPQHAEYTGTGSTDEEKNFVCR